MAKPRNLEEANHGRSTARRRTAAREVAPADWLEADEQVLRELVALVCKAGGAIRFGYTSDGGAYAVGFYGDGDPYTEYVRPSEDINYVLKAWVEAWR